MYYKYLLKVTQPVHCCFGRSPVLAELFGAFKIKCSSCRVGLLGFQSPLCDRLAVPLWMSGLTTLCLFYRTAVILTPCCWHVQQALHFLSHYHFIYLQLIYAIVSQKRDYYAIYRVCNLLSFLLPRYNGYHSRSGHRVLVHSFELLQEFSCME